MFCFVSKSDIFNFADIHTISSCGKILGDVIHYLKMVRGKIIKMKFWSNFSPRYWERIWPIKVNLFLDGHSMEKFLTVVILQLTVDYMLSFKKHIESICRTVRYKLHAL